ncbi:MAG TPA: cytidylate kinase family protein [Desulfuromonadales bacterium]|nr:cytidylate kinase family protein [Desulfuromonadales bacterium]
MAIITISREMGSGGIPIAHKVAEKLGYTLIDGDALKENAISHGLAPDAFEKADEKPPAFVEELDEKIEVDLHRIELAILEYALKGNVIVYGRGGQDLLQRLTSVFRVRIIAPFEDRVERWAEREWLDPDIARVLVRKSDQQRAGFIKYYFNRDWQDPLGYDLIINTQRLSEEMAVKLICDGVKDKNLTEQKDNSKKVLKDLILLKATEIAILSTPDLDAHHMGFQVDSGVITLTGHVHSEEEHRQVMKIAGAIPDATDVVDQLKVVEYRNYPTEL